MTEELHDVLDKIEVKAQAGLCQMTHSGTREFLKDIRKLALDALASSDSTPWIPVTRCLPEQNAKVPETAMWAQSEEVWVVVNHHGNRYIESAILRDGQWSIRNHGGFGWHERVTHWMPKPALPKV